MIKVQKKLSKKSLTLLILLGLLVLSVTAYIIVTKVTTSNSDNPSDSTLRYEPIDGESPDNRVYPYVSLDSVKTADVTVTTPDGVYGFLKGSSDSTYYMYYYDENGKQQTFCPPQMSVDPNFDYTSLYAKDKGNYGINAPRYLYLTSAVSNIYFSERIPLSENETEKAAQLRRYGLDDTKNIVKIQYIDKSGSYVTHMLRLGKQTVGKTGYYLIVDDRPYVYASSTDSLGYAYKPFAYYVNPILIASGSSSGNSSVYEAYLTVNFREYVNKVHDTVGETVPSGAEVVVSVRTRSESDSEFSTVKTRSFRLSELTSAEYGRLAAVLSGGKIGSVGQTVTLREEVTDDRWLRFGDKDSLTYTYTVTQVLSALYDTEERTTGTVGTAPSIKIRYIRKDENGEETECSGILSLSDKNLSAETVSALRALSVGGTSDGASRVSFSVTYVKDETAEKKTTNIVVRDILSVTDKDGKYLTEVTEDSYVYAYVYLEAGGRKSEAVLQLLHVTADTDEYSTSVREALLGKKAESGQNITVYAYVEEYEIMYGYTEYDISEIRAFVTEEEIVAFGFVNSANRDPFYRETYFTNKLPYTNKYSVYGLNDTHCQTVIRALGGIQDNANQAAGLFGDETVAIGLTTERMMEYGLYYSRIYIEVPRGIGSNENGTEYNWQYTLGFTMYISDVYYDTEDGTPYRYVASDVYDIIVRVNDNTFDFIDKSFTEYWARERMMLIDIGDMSSIEMKFNTEEIKGTYDFIIKHYNRQTSDGGTYTQHNVLVRPSDGYNAYFVNKYLQNHELSSDKTFDLNSLYDMTMGVDDRYAHAIYGKDFAGDGYFKDFLSTVFSVGYGGTLTEEEQAAFAENTPLFIMTVTLEKADAYRYVYEFYRGTDRQVMVRLYKADENGVQKSLPVGEFYISSLGLRRIMGAAVNLLSGVPVGSEPSFGE